MTDNGELKERYDRELDNYKSGIKQVLGVEPFSAPPTKHVECRHASDGYVYGIDEEDPSLEILMCTKCHMHYTRKIDQSLQRD